MTKKTLLKITKWFFGIFFSVILLITLALYIFKDNIIGLVLDEVNKNLKAKVSVSKVDLTFWKTFPDLSVDFNHVFIQDSYENSTERDTLLYSDLIRLRFNPMDVWSENYNVKEINISPGTLQLKINEKGVTNYDILKPVEDTVSAQPFNFKLESILISELRFVYENQISSQIYKAGISEMELQGQFYESVFTLNASADLLMNEARSGQLKLLSNKPVKFNLSIEVNQNKKTFKIPGANILVANLPLSVKGEINPELINFSIIGKKLPLEDVATHLSMNELAQVKRFKGAGTASIDLQIKGENKVDKPIGISCDFGISNGRLVEPLKQQEISNIELIGRYSNQGGSTKEFLSLKKIAFQTSTGPFSGELLITNFNEPIFKGAIDGKLNLSVVHALFRIPEVSTVEGILAVNTLFNIQILPQPDESSHYDIRKCNGIASFENVSFQLVDDKRLFEQINGDIILRENTVSVTNLGLKLTNSDLTLNGIFTNVIPYFKGEQSILADLQIKSNRIDVEDLGTTSKEDKIQESRSYLFPANIDGKLDLTVGSMGYEGHRFESINTQLSIHNRILLFKDLTFRNASATVNGNLKIEETSPEIFNATMQLSSTNLVLKSIFKEWNNFQQDVIKEENIFGTAAVNLSFEAPFDLRAGIKMAAIKSDIQLKIQDGRLKDVSAFKAITQNLKSPAARLALGGKNIIALEQKLSDLRFETLENQLIIRNGMITMPAMLIKSSLLHIEVSGKHSFANDIDYRFAFRFRDLKEKKDSEFGNVTDDGTGMNVYMRMFGNLSNPKIEWDKATSKEDRQEYNTQEKQNVKSMLKSDFGMFSKDTTISNYKKPEKGKAVLEVQYGKDTTSKDDFSNEKKKKDSKVNKWFKKMEEENKSKKKVDVDFD